MKSAIYYWSDELQVVELMCISHDDSDWFHLLDKYGTEIVLEFIFILHNSVLITYNIH